MIIYWWKLIILCQHISTKPISTNKKADTYYIIIRWKECFNITFNPPIGRLLPYEQISHMLLHPSALTIWSTYQSFSTSIARKTTKLCASVTLFHIQLFICFQMLQMSQAISTVSSTDSCCNTAKIIHEVIIIIMQVCCNNMTETTHTPDILTVGTVK
jgi:hypothetical protein